MNISLVVYYWVQVVTSVQQLSYWTFSQKPKIVKQTNKLGNSVSLLARAHGLSEA
jgi:hypothetical protein